MDGGAWWATFHGVAKELRHDLATCGSAGKESACKKKKKESACNAGDASSIPGSGSFPGEWIGYPFQYPWASLMVQMVKNLPAMQETWV